MYRCGERVVCGVKGGQIRSSRESVCGKGKEKKANWSRRPGI